MKARRGYNPKRRIAPGWSISAEQRETCAGKVAYGGNPEHKRAPGDYGLTPPAGARPGKSLCDGERTIFKAEALALLKTGFQKGMTSPFGDQAWPQNVWAVSESQEVFEAQLEDAEAGAYHGYPMPFDDDFRREVLSQWRRR